MASWLRRATNRAVVAIYPRVTGASLLHRVRITPRIIAGTVLTVAGVALDPAMRRGTDRPAARYIAEAMRLVTKLRFRRE